MVMGEATRGSCRPTSPGLQDGALKAGWLKKQRSIMKNWQLRWFVLCADHLYFYKDEEETKPQGSIPLKGSQVNELTANPEEPGRHLFEIVPVAYVVMRSPDLPMLEEMNWGIGRGRDPLCVVLWLIALQCSQQSRFWRVVTVQRDPVPTEPRKDWPALPVPSVREEDLEEMEHGDLAFGGDPGPISNSRGKAGEKDKAAISHESFLLMANSQNDMDDWVKTIRRAIWAPFGGGKFGQHLEDTVQYERKFGPRLAPLIVEQCVDFIREQGLDEEGLFRMPGQANLVKDLQEAFDCGDKPQFDSNTDVHTVASLLKLYLRELPEPVIPFSKYENFLSCAQLLAKDEEEGTQELGKLVKTLPVANYNLLKYICKFLDEVQSYSHENKMGVQNLATVFGPNILRPKKEDPVTIMEGTALVQHLMTVLISKHHLYIEKDSETSQFQAEVRFQGQQHQQTNLVDWISEEDLHPCPPTGKNANTNDSPSNNSASSVDASQASFTSKSVAPGKGDTAVSPSKQAKTLPGWKYSFKGSPPRPQSAKVGGTTVDVSTASSGNWLMNGLSSLRGHRRTSSGERSRDSGTSQRLSTYDNVTSSSSLGSVLIIDSTPLSTSSCEISVSDSGSDPLGTDSRTEDNLQSVKSVQETPQSDEDVKLTVKEDSIISVENGAGSDNGNVAPIIRVVDEGTVESHSSLSGEVAELKEELREQQQVYESRIKKLEESSAALCFHMERLEQEMEQERKRKKMLEIKLRNSERAREDAENRNCLLEKEMEDFFSTLGDLALGSSHNSDI
ncbi:Rho GTPase-activating protein 22 [Triplophysa tibetana]|uniref:Rho GTPase-activating protein 22 n=1 Tax=Triplophysa tibetana TaxID=1572043 RepID=A0A5A9Q000_9TELE|nr:Rho GTPase-activating protein 22 [Triplophysa tibetana]